MPWPRSDEHDPTDTEGELRREVKQLQRRVEILQRRLDCTRRACLDLMAARGPSEIECVEDCQKVEEEVTP